MHKRRIRSIIAVMSVALLGIILLQVYWIVNGFRLKEQQFEQSVNQAMNAIVDRIETSEALEMLHDSLLGINTANINRMVVQDTSENIPITITDQGIAIPPSRGSFPPPIWEDLDNADVNIEFHLPGSAQTFLRFQHRNIIHRDSVSEHSIRSSKIMRIFGDSGEVIIRQNEEKFKARIEKLNEVVRKMALEFNDTDYDLRTRVSTIGLDSLIGCELKNRGIDQVYDYGVLNGKTNSLILSRATILPEELLNAKYKTLLFPNDLIAKPDYLLLNFHNSIGYVLSSMWIMLACSSIFTFIILFGFAYTIQVIIRQKKLSDIKSDFINNMTHEFKTPIATISLAVDSIRDPRVATNPEKMNYFTRIIKDENKRMNAQVEHVLQMAQIDKEELQLGMQDLNIHELIQKAVELINLQVERRNGHIHMHLRAWIPVIVGDPIHLSNVIINLLDNANKYSRENPEITVFTNNIRDGIIVGVRDKGIGMDKDTQKLVFEKFYRVPTGNLHDIKGFGLGLSYVKAIIEKHAGWINVTSEIGNGSTFEFFLPFR